jgi:1,4-dihydroxy-2-naphthoyl-CoA hydrolase
MEFDESLGAKLEAIRGVSTTLAAHMGIEYRRLFRDEVVISMEVLPHHLQPFGILHGGASLVLAETAASVGGWLHLLDEREYAVGLEINANHLRPAQAGDTLTARATPIHTGSTTQVWDVRISNAAEKLVCISRCTLAVRRR